MESPKSSNSQQVIAVGNRPSQKQVCQIRTVHPTNSPKAPKAKNHQGDKPSTKDGGECRFPTSSCFFATVIIAVASVLSLITVIVQIGGSSAQTERLISASERIAAAMEGSVGQAKIAFDAANKQAIVSQRAWIHVIVETKPHANKQAFVIGQPLEIQVTTKNTGRTPAIAVRSVSRRDVVERDKNNIFPYPSFLYTDRDYVFGGNLNPDSWSYGDFCPASSILSGQRQLDFPMLFEIPAAVGAVGKVGIPRVFAGFPRAVGREENLLLVFLPFHGPAFSTALRPPRCCC